MNDITILSQAIRRKTINHLDQVSNSDALILNRGSVVEQIISQLSGLPITGDPHLADKILFGFEDPAFDYTSISSSDLGLLEPVTSFLRKKGHIIFYENMGTVHEIIRVPYLSIRIDYRSTIPSFIQGCRDIVDLVNVLSKYHSENKKLKLDEVPHCPVVNNGVFCDNYSSFFSPKLCSAHLFRLKSDDMKKTVGDVRFVPTEFLQYEKAEKKIMLSLMGLKQFNTDTKTKTNNCIVCGNKFSSLIYPGYASGRICHICSMKIDWSMFEVDFANGIIAWDDEPKQIRKYMY